MADIERSIAKDITDSFFHTVDKTVEFTEHDMTLVRRATMRMAILGANAMMPGTDADEFKTKLETELSTLAHKGAYVVEHLKSCALVVFKNAHDAVMNLFSQEEAQSVVMPTEKKAELDQSEAPAEGAVFSGEKQ